MSFIYQCRKPKHLRMIEKAQSCVEKELDLKRFLDKIRFQTTASIVLLSPRQRAFIERMRHIVVPSDTISSSSELSSSHEQNETELNFL